MFILCISISIIIYCIFNIINIDIHVQLMSVFCKPHFMGVYFSQLSCLHDKPIIDSDLLITHFSNNVDQFSLQSVRVGN